MPMVPTPAARLPATLSVPPLTLREKVDPLPAAEAFNETAAAVSFPMLTLPVEFNVRVPALSVLATVISKTPGERIVVDSGVKALSGERGLPTVKNDPALRLKALNAEHAVIETTDSSVSVNVGDKIEIWVRYHDGTVHLHQRMYGIRNGAVEEVFEIEH